MVRIQCFHCYGPGSIAGRGTEIPKQCGEAKIKKEMSQDVILQVCHFDLFLTISRVLKEFCFCWMLCLCPHIWALGVLGPQSKHLPGFSTLSLWG